MKLPDYKNALCIMDHECQRCHNITKCDTYIWACPWRHDDEDQMCNFCMGQVADEMEAYQAEQEDFLLAAAIPTNKRAVMEAVDAAAAKSTDPSTHIGAVLVMRGQILAADCNRFPKGVHDTPERNERPAKYMFYEHAERNVIYDAAFHGLRTAGAVLYTTGIPCADCARAAIQAGINEVVVWKRGSGLEATDRWYASIVAGGEMLREAGVLITEIER